MDISEVMGNLNNNLIGFNVYINFINENPLIRPHLKKLVEVINLIKDKISGMIILNKIALIFELIFLYLNN